MGARDRGDQLVGRQAEPGGPDREWSNLYSGGRPRETGVGAATVRGQRRRRRRLWAAALVVLIALGATAYVVTPRWWWSTKAYVDHLGYGPYEGEMPSDLHAQLAHVMPGLISFVERERGLTFQSAPSVVFLPDSMFKDELDSHIAFEQRHYVGGQTYDALGWVHNGDTFSRLSLDLHGDGVVSLYGDWDGTIYLRGHSLTPLAKAEIVGLLTQSLDDQTFNLNALYGTQAEQDERTAYDALVSGDDRYVERAYIASLPAGERCSLSASTGLRIARCAAAGSQSGAQSGAPAGARADGPIPAEIAFPATYGLAFVEQLRAQGGPKAVDAAFRHPPRSTADIMSIPHYRLDRAFRVLSFPPSAGRLVDFGTLGAYTLSLVLADGRPAEVDAGHTVVGWRGDSFSTYVHGSRTCVRDLVVFDTDAQAARFVTQASAAHIPVTAGPAHDAANLQICH